MLSIDALPWLLPPPDDFGRSLKALNTDTADVVGTLHRLSSYALNANQLTSLSKKVALCDSAGPAAAALSKVRLGILSNGTISLAAATFPASGIRHGVALSVSTVEYDAILGAASGDHPAFTEFEPELVMLAIDHRGLPFANMAAGISSDAVIAPAIAYLKMLRDAVRQRYGAPVIFQTIATPPTSLFGNLDRSISGTWRSTIHALNVAIVDLAKSGDYLIDIAELVERTGSENWFNEPQWLMHKLPFDFRFAPIFGDYVGRLIGAIRGRSKKCLVLDLDNTLWGGAIGDEGLSGIVLGQGSAEGEAFIEVQKFALALRERGIMLAVSSKNDEHNARLPFQQHPDMLLKEHHISVFQANWVDKASNIEAIAKTLQIGLDALIFLDDNPAERAFVRGALPMVAVPELPSDPSYYVWTLAAAGYFEAISFSQEDRARADSYSAEAQRVGLRQQVRDIGDYLSSLEMVLTAEPFTAVGRSRIAQLVNKSNQFNLTTKRYTEAEIEAIELNPEHYTLQTRLRDKYGDSGMIGVIIAAKSTYQGEAAWNIDSWLMSCRVLGRKVEEAMLAEVARSARLGNIRYLLATYIPTAKNTIVREHYDKLGFQQIDKSASGMTSWLLDLSAYTTGKLPIKTESRVND